MAGNQKAEQKMYDQGVKVLQNHEFLYLLNPTDGSEPFGSRVDAELRRLGSYRLKTEEYDLAIKLESSGEDEKRTASYILKTRSR